MKPLILATAGLLLSGLPAAAQMDSREGIALQNQILQLRHDVQTLQDNQGSGSRSSIRSAPSSGDTGGLTAQLLDRVTSLEEQTRQMRGLLDRVTQQQQRDTEDLNKKIADMNFALQNGAVSSPPFAGGRVLQAAPPSVLGAEPPVRTPTPREPAALTPPPRTPEMAMQEGNAALARRDYSAAEADAREVLTRRSPRSADAQFLLAQAELGQRNYQQAAPDFYDAYNRQRTGPRAPNALLGVANALTGLGDKTSACEALTKLRTEFPQPSADVRDGELAVRQRAGCR